MNPSRWLVLLAFVVSAPAFSQGRELPDFTWERTDRADALREAAGIGAGATA